MHAATKTILILAVVTIGLAAAGAADVAAEEDDLAINVTETDAEPVVTVTSNESAVENASVNVTTAADQNVTYAGEGDYETDVNGTVTLPAAEENVTVNVTASADNQTAATSADLIAAEDADEPEEPEPFGQQLREFISGLSDRSGGIGPAVSDFATDNNPGNAPDHAGGPGNASDAPGNDSTNASDDRNGPPSHAGSNGDGGPPDHAGNGSNGAAHADDTAENESETDEAAVDDDSDSSSDAADESDGPDDDDGGNSDDDAPGNSGGQGNSDGAPGNGGGPGN